MYKVGTRFVDERTGDIWELRFKYGDTPYVWNDKLGEGHWDYGRHLTKIKSPAITEAIESDDSRGSRSISL